MKTPNTTTLGFRYATHEEVTNLYLTVGARFWVGANRVTDASSHTSRGSYLVRSVIPVPASVWLFSSGLIGLIGIARRKKS